MTPVYLDDVVTGIFCCLFLSRCFIIDFLRFGKSVTLSADFIDKELLAAGLVPRFIIRPHFIHGDSPAVENAIFAACRRGLSRVSLGEIYFRISNDEAEKILVDLPGGSDLYKRLTQKIVSIYEAG